MKLTGASVNHNMVSGNAIQHQTQERPEQEAPATMCVVRERERIPPSHIIALTSSTQHAKGMNPKMA